MYFYDSRNLFGKRRITEIYENRNIESRNFSRVGSSLYSGIMTENRRKFDSFVSSFPIFLWARKVESTPFTNSRPPSSENRFASSTASFTDTTGGISDEGAYRISARAIMRIKIWRVGSVSMSNFGAKYAIYPSNSCSWANMISSIWSIYASSLSIQWAHEKYDSIKRSRSKSAHHKARE